MIPQIYVISTTNAPWSMDRAFSRRFGVKIYVPPPTFEERKPIMKSMVGSNNSVTEQEWSLLVNETKQLTISGLRDHIKSAKEKVQEELINAKFWIQYETAQGLKWTPCPPHWKGAIERDVINLSNTYEPKIRYLDLTVKAINSKKLLDKSAKKNWAERMRVSDEELKILSGVKSNESYTQAQYEAFMKQEQCTK